jgi:hypothetical protein
MTSELMKELTRIYGVQTTGKIPIHPMSRGQVESIHRILQDYLAKYVNSTGRQDWHKTISYFLLAYRKTPLSRGAYSPHELLFGRRMNFLPDFGVREFDYRPSMPQPSYARYMDDMQRHAETANRWCRDRGTTRLQSERTQEFPIVHPPKFPDGAKAWWKTSTNVRQRQKLDSHWVPVRVVRLLPGSHVTYLIEFSDGRRRYAHVRDLGKRR